MVLDVDAFDMLKSNRAAPLRAAYRSLPPLQLKHCRHNKMLFEAQADADTTSRPLSSLWDQAQTTR